MDDCAYFFNRCPCLMDRFWRDIVARKFVERFFKVESCDDLEFLPDRLSTPEMKTQFS